MFDGPPYGLGWRDILIFAQPRRVTARHRMLFHDHWRRLSQGGWQAQIYKFERYSATNPRRIPLSCHRVRSPPPTRGHKIRVIGAQIEFPGGTGKRPGVARLFPVLWVRSSLHG